MKYKTIALAIALLLSSLPAAYAYVEEVTITPSYETAGVIVRLDRDPSGVDVRLEVRKQGESVFRPQHAFVRYDARHMATSLFDLQPNTPYTAKIIDGQHEILQSFSTKAPFSVPSPLRVVNVADRAQLVNALADAQAGDQIVVAQGTYTGGFLVENKHGTAQHPIVIKGDVSASDLSKPIAQRTSLPIIRDAHLHPVYGMETGLYISGSSHIIVDGLRFESNQRSALRLDNSRDCVVQNSQSVDNGAYTQAAMLIYDGGASTGRHLIQYNYFYENVNRSDSAEYGLVNDYNPGPGTVMRGNVFVGFQNAVVPCTNEDSTQNVSVNDMDVLADWPINDIEVYDNDFIDIYGDAIEADGICINARIYRNKVSGHITYSPISIAPALPGPIFFVRNIVSAAYRGSAVKFNTAKGRGTIRNIFFYHNTFMRTQEANTDWGALSFWDGTPSENIVFKNNIITSVDKLSTIQEEWTHKPAMDYNLWYSSLGINAPVFVYWGNPGFAVGWEGWKTQTGYEAHGVWGQPMLDGNFRPANGSPAIDKGVVIPGISNSYSGSAPDIGAVESVAAARTEICGDPNSVVQDQTFTSGAFVICTASQSITTQGTVEVQSSADVAFVSQSMQLNPGFSADSGSTFRALKPVVLASTASTYAKSTLSTSGSEDATGDAQDHGLATVPTSHRLANDEIPAPLVDVVRNADAHVTDLFVDDEGWYVVFSTETALVPSDSNGMSDVYLYDVWTDQIRLVSQSITGGAGNGASSRPRISGSGEDIVYQSDADDLVIGDTNGVTDIFLYCVTSGVNKRVSWRLDNTQAERPSLDAAIGNQGRRVLYDREDDTGYRQVYGFDRRWPAEITEQVSFVEDDQGNLVDNHHPGISADGRYIAYLETTRATESAAATCHVHVYDTVDEHYARIPCPEELDADAAPFFGKEGNRIEWVVEEPDEQPGIAENQVLTPRKVVEMTNPLSITE